jgi:hypothetical protein
MDDAARKPPNEYALPGGLREGATGDGTPCAHLVADHVGDLWRCANCGATHRSPTFDERELKSCGVPVEWPCGCAYEARSD